MAPSVAVTSVTVTVSVSVTYCTTWRGDSLPGWQGRRKDDDTTRMWSQGDHSGKPITKSQGEGVRAWVDTDIALV